MKTLHASLILIAGAMALSACGGEQKTSTAKGSGQVLEGSISDAMLPYDTVRSQPPHEDPLASGAAYDADAAISIGRPAATASEAAETAADAAGPVTPDAE